MKKLILLFLAANLLACSGGMEGTYSGSNGYVKV
jgi:hypothetical protein